MIKLRTTVTLVAALALAAGSASVVMAADEPSPEASMGPVGVFGIEGMPWLLTAQLVDGEMTPVPDGVVVSLTMADGQADGNGGCNNYFSSYTIDGFDLTFGPIGSTLMSCEGPAGDVDSAYLTNLAQVASYQSGGIQMALKDAAGDFLLEFDLAPPASVVGSWTAEGINNGAGGVVSSAMTPLVTAVFSEAGGLIGNDGCNDYFTTYESDRDTITVTPEIATTRMACLDDDLAQQSQEYFAALGAATTWSVDAKGALELRDDSGALQVRFTPASS